MKLYFESSNGTRRLIAEPNTDNEVFKEIKKFLEERNYKSYYTRIWMTPNGEKYFDCGSWSEFFVLVNN